MKLRIPVRFFALAAALVAPLLFTSPLSVRADDQGDGDSPLYQLPLASGSFSITQYPERALTATGRSADFACSHKSGRRNAEAYDVVPKIGTLSPTSPLPVLAVADGKVIYAGVEYRLITQGFGRYVVLEHENGVRSLYAHLSSIPFTPAQMETYFAYRKDTTKTPLRVSAGSVIGYMGSTGEPGDHHLHFSLYSAVGRSGANNLGTPRRADAHFPDFVLGSSEPAIAAKIAFSPLGCEGASFTSNPGAQEEGSGDIAGGLVPKFSSTTGSVTVKTGSLGFRILYDRVNALYAFSIGIGGILAFLLIIYAGVRYSLSLGNASKAKEALDQVQAALTGLVLLLALYPILYTVNPCIVDPLRMGDRRDKEGRMVRVPICAVSQLFGAGSGTVTAVNAYKDVTAAAPTLGNTCVGPASYEQSGQKLVELAQALCAGSRGSLPTVGEVHAKLVSTQKNGAAGCTAKDTEAILTLMRADTSCARAGEPGGVVGDASITKATVHASICSKLERGGIQGWVFGVPEEVERTYKGFAKGSINEDPQRKSESLLQIAKNVPALVAYCKAQIEVPPWCSLRVGVVSASKSPLALKNLTPEQERLLVNVCADVGSFGNPKEYFSAPVPAPVFGPPAPVTPPSAPSSGGSSAVWDWSVEFTDQDGRPVLRAVKGQKLKLTAKTGPQTEKVFFEIWENDSVVLTRTNAMNNEPIRTLSIKNAIEGKIGSDGIARGEWMITQNDLERGGDDSWDLEFLLSARTESGKKKSSIFVSKAGKVSVDTDEKKKPDPPLIRELESPPASQSQ